MDIPSRGRSTAILLGMAVFLLVVGATGGAVVTSFAWNHGDDQFDALLRGLDSGELRPGAAWPELGKSVMSARYRETDASEPYYVQGFRSGSAWIIIYSTSEGPYAAQGVSLSHWRDDIWWFIDETKLAEHARLSALDYRSRTGKP